MNVCRREIILSNERKRVWCEYSSPLIHNKKVPLVFCLHGGGTDGYHAFECGNLKAVADQHPMIIVSPYIDDVPRSFDIRPESGCVQLAKEFYDAVLLLYEGLYSRIFVMGYSIGEFLAFQMCRKYPHLVDAFGGAVAPAPGETFNDGNGEPIFYKGQKPIPAFIWRGDADFLYSTYTMGSPDREVQNKVAQEYKQYWKRWNHVEECHTEKEKDYTIETYGESDNQLIHVIAKGKGHSDEEDVFQMAWERLFSRSL